MSTLKLPAPLLIILLAVWFRSFYSVKPQIRRKLVFFSRIFVDNFGCGSLGLTEILLWITSYPALTRALLWACPNEHQISTFCQWLFVSARTELRVSLLVKGMVKIFTRLHKPDASYRNLGMNCGWNIIVLFCSWWSEFKLPADICFFSEKEWSSRIKLNNVPIFQFINLPLIWSHLDF